MIFHDDAHIHYAYSLKECFQSLDYDVKVIAIEEIRETLGNKLILYHVINKKCLIASKNLMRKFKYDGSLVICVLGQLREEKAGLSFLYGQQQCIPLVEIVDRFSGSNCKHLVGKPKLFFFLDDGTKLDNVAIPQNQVYIHHELQ